MAFLAVGQNPSAAGQGRPASPGHARPQARAHSAQKGPTCSRALAGPGDLPLRAAGPPPVCHVPIMATLSLQPHDLSVFLPCNCVGGSAAQQAPCSLPIPNYPPLAAPGPGLCTWLCTQRLGSSQCISPFPPLGKSHYGGPRTGADGGLGAGPLVPSEALREGTHPNSASIWFFLPKLTSRWAWRDLVLWA